MANIKFPTDTSGKTPIGADLIPIADTEDSNNLKEVTVTNLGTAIASINADISANTLARHNAVTVTDSSEIDFTLTGQDITASLKTTAVTPGSYTSSNVTVDSKGRVTSISSGSGGLGDVVGPGSATDNAVARFDSTTGKLIQDSTVTVSDGGDITANAYNDNVGGVSTLSGLVVVDGTLAAGTGLVVNEVITGADTNAKLQKSGTGRWLYGNSYSAPTIDNEVTPKKYVDDNLTNKVVGPASSTDNAIARYDTTTGKLLQDSGVTVDDNGTVNIPAGQTYNINGSPLSLDNLSDLIITTPVTDEFIRYNGTDWVNGQGATISAGPGIEFFNATPVLTATGTDNAFPVASLSKTPIITAEQTVSGTATSNTTMFGAWLYNTALGRTTLDAGIWGFETYCAVNSILAGRVTTLTRQIYQVTPSTTEAYTITITGTGTSRTATASSGTPFLGTKAVGSATNTDASYLYTPAGIFQITAKTSPTEVTIKTLTTYVNESAVACSVWKKLFGVTSGTITATGTNYSLTSFQTSQGAFTVATTDKLGAISFVTSNNTTTLTLTYNGTTRNTHFSTPLITMHNNLAGLNGGTSNEYYHLTLAEYTGSGSGVFARVTNPVFSAGITLGTASASAGSITLKNASNANNIILQAGVTGASITYTLPTTAPTTGQVLSSTDAGVMSWATAGGTFWTAMPGTPTRVSNTTFTVTGDITTYVAKGMIIKWTETGTVRCAIVAIPSTYGAPNTTITIIGDTMASIDASSLKYCFLDIQQFVEKFAIAGTIGATGTDVANSYYAREPMRVIGADLSVGTAGTTNNTTVDINKAGTTMFTTKPTLATTVASSPLAFTSDTATSLALGDKVTLDIDAIQTTAAIDLYVQLYLFPTRLLNLT